jgi:hypothetical protein
MSSKTLGPLFETFSFCVIGPEPVAIDLNVCICVSGAVVSQLPDEDAEYWAELPPWLGALPLESCVIVTD